MYKMLTEVDYMIDFILKETIGSNVLIQCDWAAFVAYAALSYNLKGL